MVTLKEIKYQKPCETGWIKLLESLNKTKADNTQVSIKHLLESIGISDTLWVIVNCIPDELEKKRNMFADFTESAVNHAESVLHIFEKERPNDNRPRLAIEESKKLIGLLRDGRDTRAAGDAAWAAAWDAWDAGNAAREAAGAAWAARAVAWAAAGAADSAARAVAWAPGAAAGAARAVAWASWDARDAARAAARAADSAAWAAAEDAAKKEEEKQKDIILKYFG